MNILYDAALRQPLLAFVFAYFILTIIWSEIRRTHPALANARLYFTTNHSPLIKRIKAYKMLALLFMGVAVCFSKFPAFYDALIPIEFFKSPLFNLLGILTLLYSLFFVVIVQMDIDKELHLSSLTSTEANMQLLSAYGNKLANGYFLMFLGMSTLLANAFCLILFFIAYLLYDRRRFSFRNL